MKICVITDGKKDAGIRLPACDLAVFGFNAFGEVNYESELAGKSDKLEKLARLSGSAHCGVLCGCITDSRGLLRKSVAVAGGGKLLGISDMLNVLDDEKYKSGANLGVYQLGVCKVGLCIDGDLYFPELVKSLALCGCNLVAVHTEDVSDGVAPLLIRAYSYLYGMPFVLSGGGVAYFADVTGVVACSNQQVAVFETTFKNSYRVVTSRRRGILCDGAADY